MGLDSDTIDRGAITLETRIPVGRKVDGLEYGAHVDQVARGWCGYYVRPTGTDRWGVARMTPASDELPEPEEDEDIDEAIVRCVLAELGTNYRLERHGNSDHPTLIREPERRLLYIGHDGERVVDSAATRKQIDDLKSNQSGLVDADGEPIPWDALDNPEEPRTLLNFIVADRTRRVDEKTMMADRPPSAVATVVDGVVVRLQFYEGHDALSKTYDLRSKELQGVDLPDWMEHDPQAYDPVAYLETLGFPADFTKPIIEAAHKRHLGSGEIDNEGASR